jgi:phosphoribosylaminoimidazolecarboxamide formyltransferase / IMP cyclohydrolase
MTINSVEKIDNDVRVRHVLVSVSDKSGLTEFIPELTKMDPAIKFFSTGGTYAKLKNILGNSAESRLVKVSDYTGQPETQGGLVKTLDFKIYLGLLTETYNDAHQQDIARTNSVPIDMVVVNLYPFRETISRQGVTPEEARGNIDIGGPCMIRASAKNFLRVAPVVEPSDYELILDEMKRHNGRTTLEMRYRLAQKAFRHTAEYDAMISEYLADTGFSDVENCFSFEA